jgi:Glycosyltransferase family 92
LISCPIVNIRKVPRSVSLTTNRCDSAENNLQIIDNHPTDGVKKEFGVCVKQLTYPNRDFIVRFIEWVHMLRILGNTKVHFYNRMVHPELIKVVDYFESKDLVDMKPFLEPSCLSNDQLASHDTMVIEHSVINDCFYRTKNLYKYLAILDPDEVIIPLNENDRSWQNLFKRFNQSYDIYRQNMIFYPNIEKEPIEGIPKENYILQHVQVSVILIKRLYDVIFLTNIYRKLKK